MVKKQQPVASTQPLDVRQALWQQAQAIYNAAPRAADALAQLEAISGQFDGWSFEMLNVGRLISALSTEEAGR